MAYKILERCLCPSCEREMTEANVVHKKVPYTEGSAVCDWCHKKRYCTRYKVQVGKGEADGRTKPISKEEINERALWIAADMLVVAGYSTEDAEPGEPHKMRRWIRNKARLELLNERRERRRE